MRVPLQGDRVIEVPQSQHYLLRDLDGKTLAEALMHVGHRYGSPRFKQFDARTDPGLGYGLLVIEGFQPGTVHAGPTNWDSGD